MRTGQAMATATLVSRVTGFVRVLTLVAALGLGTRLLDAYTVANVTPNSIYELVMGGALASVIVPLLIRTAADENTDDELFAQRLLSLIVYALAVVVIVTIIAAPLLMDLYASGFTPEQRRTAIVFTRFFLPQILFYGVSAALAAILNARDRFVSPMWAPVANNLVVITTALVFVVIGGTGRLETLTQAQTLLLSIGTSAGVAVQMLVLIVAGRRAGFRVRLRADPRGIGIRRIGVMAGWTVLSVIAAQAVFVVITDLASQAGPGAVSVYSNAYTLFQLPYAVIAVTIITGVLPMMSRSAAGRDFPRVTADLSRSLRLSSTVLVPVAAGLVVLGPQLATVLFAHGNASPEAARLTGSVLAAYGLALVPFAGYQIMLRVFYAFGDTRTPALISTGVSAVTIATCLVAARLTPGPDLVIAIAGCTALAYATGLVVTAAVLRRRIGLLDGHRLLDAHARMLVAATVAGLTAAVTVRSLQSAVGTAWTGSAVTVLLAAAAGAGLYALGARGLRIAEFGELTAMIRTGRA
ncbi:putative peptidoglycan lipid II flippase [Streptosporangium lutulentum]|uniref:Peptidoglycan lipid II flippase n=2 Tax=Streptosporangium lutulentum TaxID=1461250 RepID=A0ABT9Q5W2_9ACTN|nr:murein biosynthesis integral membrane protein MurJ [Streptosporangium lutulentum]MDP9842098.1 putative peptidoglycan lipid II flippase [Streptosporangium lutulentum]